MSGFRPSSSLRGNRPAWLWRLAFLILGAHFLPACDEVLPPREQPQKFIDMTLDVSPKEYITIDPSKGWQELSFILTLRNAYDEVLEDTAHIRGSVDIWFQGDRSVHASVKGGEPELIGGTVPRNGILTLRPDSAVVMKLDWNHFTDRNLLVWWYVQRKDTVDNVGRTFFRTEPVVLFVKASLQVFKNVQALTATAARVATVYRVYSTNLGPYAVLPFPVTNFRGFGYRSKYVKLFWETQLEIKNYGFLVERKLSGDTAAYAPGRNWFVPGNGTTSAFHAYMVTDTVSGSGTWLYRLWQLADVFDTYHPALQEIGPIEVVVP